MLKFVLAQLKLLDCKDNSMHTIPTVHMIDLPKIKIILGVRERKRFSRVKSRSKENISKNSNRLKLSKKT